jgi:hypothetical protein
VEKYIGNAKVSVFWKVPNKRLAEDLEQSTHVFRSRNEGRTYRSRSKGYFRQNVPVTIKATMPDSSALFPSTGTVFEYGELGNTRNKEVTKTKCIE